MLKTKHLSLHVLIHPLECLQINASLVELYDIITQKKCATTKTVCSKVPRDLFALRDEDKSTMSSRCALSICVLSWCLSSLAFYHCNSCMSFDIFMAICAWRYKLQWFNRLCHAHSFYFITKVVDRIFNILLSIARQKFDARLLTQHTVIRYNVRYIYICICCGNNVWICGIVAKDIPWGSELSATHYGWPLLWKWKVYCCLQWCWSCIIELLCESRERNCENLLNC